MLSYWLRALPPLVLVASMMGCSFDQSGLGESDGGLSPADARPGADARESPDASESPADALPASDAVVTPPDASACADLLTLEPLNFDECDVPAPTGSISLTSSGGLTLRVLDTDAPAITDSDGNVVQALADTAVVSQSGGPDILIVSAESFELSQGVVLTVTGSRALALVSTGDMTINGWIHAGADLATPGPGGNHAAACATGTGADGVVQEDDEDNDGGTGGGGGSYGGTGGRGARVAGAEGSSSPTAAGQQNGTAELTPLRGGCAGGAGGRSGGAGGGGGGAVQLVASGAITVGGWVSARGGGGVGAASTSGGGGGAGSGGAILVQASELTVGAQAYVTAHGGGGGEGATSGGNGGKGADGANGYTNSVAGAPGGSGATLGGNGGNGGAGTAAGNGTVGVELDSVASGGGGGGGGVGRIRFVVTGTTTIQPGATISPALP